MESLFHLAPGVTPLFVEGGAVVEAVDGFLVTHDPLHTAVLRALARVPRSRAALSTVLPPNIGPGEAAEAVSALLAAGAIQELPAPLTPAAAALWESIGVSAVEAAVAVTSRAISTVGRGVRPRALADALREWGFSPEEAGRTLRAVVVADPLDPGLREENAAALLTDTPWLLAAPAGAGVWMTLFRPGRTACWGCLVVRLLHNRPARALGRPRRGPAVPLTREATNRLATAIAAFAARGEIPELEGYWTHFGSTPDVRHPLNRLPHCRECGALPQDLHPLNDDAVCTPPPDYRHLVSPVTGIARDLRILDTPVGTFAAVVRYRFPDRADSLYMLMQNERHVAGGKGWTPEEAARAAAFETAEHLSGCYRPSLFTRLATAADLGPSALLPRETDLFSEVQRACPSPLGPPTRLTVPADLDPTLPTRWVRGWPLGLDAPLVWYPAGAAFYGYPFEGRRFALATSNGCAAGPTPEAAAVGGLLELVERDAAAIWWYNRIRRPALDLDVLGDPRPSQMRQTLHRIGRTLDVLNITTDLGVPAVVAVSRRAAGPAGWTLGFGAAEDFTVASCRAVTELAQLLPATDDPNRPNPAPWTDSDCAEDTFHLVPDGLVVPPPGTLARGLDPLIDALHGADLRAYVVDQTHPLVGVPVVRVLVPGLVHFWRRLGAPRLYEVPVRMGWRAHPTAETDMNPMDLAL